MIFLPKYAAAKYIKITYVKQEKIQKEYDTGDLQKSENKTMWLLKSV